MGKKQKIKSDYYAAEAAQAQAAQAQAAAQAANILRTNLNTNLQGNNAPDIQTSVVGAEGTQLVGGSSVKRRRAIGALSSQLGINI